MAKRKIVQQESVIKLSDLLHERVCEIADMVVEYEESFDDYKVYHSGELVTKIRNYRRGFIYAIRAINPDYEVIMVSPQATEEEEP